MAKRRRSEPLRYQIRNEILDLLIQDDYRPGDKLPTEQELTNILDVSRSTLREGLHLLEEERLIRTRHGTGRFLVSTPKDFKFDISRLQSVTEMLAGYELHSTCRVLGFHKDPCDAQIAAKLELEVGEPVISIERVRYADKVPVIYSIDILPAKKLDEPLEASMFEGSLLQVLEERCGIILDYSRATIRAVLTKGQVPASVVPDPLVPWILLEQVNFNIEGEPVIYSCDFHHGDYVTFHVKRSRH